MVAIQTTHRDALAVAFQFPALKAELAAVIGLDGQTAVGPKLALSTEAMPFDIGCNRNLSQPRIIVSESDCQEFQNNYNARRS